MSLYAKTNNVNVSRIYLDLKLLLFVAVSAGV